MRDAFPNRLKDVGVAPIMRLIALFRPVGKLTRRPFKAACLEIPLSVQRRLKERGGDR